MSVARFTLGPRLKAHRERQGITLQDIADSTKIGISLLSSLERNDVSQWPKGIFRRAFLRSYTKAIDIPFEPIWTEFSQLFPEDGSAPTLARMAQGAPLRLMLDGRVRRGVPDKRTLLAAGLDLAAVVVVGVATSWASGLSAWTTVALASLLCLTASAIFGGGSLSLAYLRSMRTRPALDTLDHDPVIERQSSPSSASLTLTRDDDAQPAASSARPRPRIVAVPSNHSSNAAEVRARRVGDR